MSIAKVKDMLEIGIECGLVTLNEAYSNYMMHYDAFFSIDNYSEEYGQFIDVISSLDLLIQTPQGKVLKDMTIEQALTIIEEKA